MIEVLAFALFKTLAVYLFDRQLRQQDTVRIEGAPRWYYQPVDDHVCASSYAVGDLEAIAAAKKGARAALAKTVTVTVDTMVDEQFQHEEDPAARELLARFKEEEGLNAFIAGHVRYRNVEYRKELRKGFVRACVDRESLLDYEHRRLQELQVAVIEKYRAEAFDTLERETTDFPQAYPPSTVTFGPLPPRADPPSVPSRDAFREMERGLPPP